jgi:hypothetical protein
MVIRSQLTVLANTTAGDDSLLRDMASSPSASGVGDRMPFLSTARGSARLRSAAGIAFAMLLSATSATPSSAQSIDCGHLRQQIAAGGGNRTAGAARKQSAELARTSAYAHQLGCDRQQFLFFGGSTAPQCGGLNARIAQMQANLGQLQAAGGGGRDELVARFNAYCRGGQQSAGQQQPRQRGFFESLFGGGEEQRQTPPPAELPSTAEDVEGGGEGVNAHGGSQAVCVRSCDGGFFPMNMSAHHNGETLSEMCTALCPGTQAAVYTRNPNSEIKTAVSLDGTPYMDLPNALKFQKSFDNTCTCRPAGKTWAESLVSAEAALGSQRKGDIMVTPEKAAELSRPKMDSKTRASLIAAAPAAAPAQAATATDAKPELDQASEVAGPDGVKRHVRTVGPKL